MTPCTGTYALILHNRRARTLSIGKIGLCTFPGAIMCTPAPPSAPGVWQTRHPDRQECIWAGHFQTLGGKIIAPGFGASDCRPSALNQL